MCGKLENGVFQLFFNLFKWGDVFMEGNSFYYIWLVFYDIVGLMELMGGEEVFVVWFDEVFIMFFKFDDSYYGFIIYEIWEMQIVNMGNYVYGNQFIQYMIYLYNFVGQFWKVQAWFWEVMEKFY